jgi:folate-binding protein YgfZ
LPVEIRRVELGIPRYGRELTDDVNPLEAGLEEHISFTKGCYVGQEVIARLKTYGKTNRRLVGFVFHSDVEVLPGTVVKANGHEVGKVTSSAYSIAQHRNIGLGYLRIDSYVPGVRLTAGIPGNEVECKTRELPPRD